MIEQALENATIYQMLSGMAHGRPWATMGLAYAKVSGVTVPPVPAGYAAVMTQRMTGEQFVFLVVHPVRWFARAAWLLFAFRGWDLEALGSLLETEYRNAGMSAVIGSWRDV
jgi:hypothetical protein